MVKDVGFVGSREIEVGVIGEVEVGGFCGIGGVSDSQVLSQEFIIHRNFHFSGKALLAIRADMGEFDSIGNDFRPKYLAMKPCLATMNVNLCSLIIGVKIITLAVNSEARSINSVGKPADYLPP